jgi:hypothetical protein
LQKRIGGAKPRRRRLELQRVVERRRLQDEAEACRKTLRKSGMKARAGETDPPLDSGRAERASISGAPSPKNDTGVACRQIAHSARVRSHLQPDGRAA